MGQTRVSSLGILNMENENIDQLNIDAVLEEFSARSNRYLKFIMNSKLFDQLYFNYFKYIRINKS